MSLITLTDGRVVSKKDYIQAKTKDLVEFGYTNLTEDEVAVQVEHILAKEEISVIGHFCKDDIKVD